MIKIIKAWIIFWIAIGIGWVLNLIQIISHMHDYISLFMIIKILGLFAAPLGGILGWVGLFQ